jgi:hypothetical protein
MRRSGVFTHLHKSDLWETQFREMAIRYSELTESAANARNR